MEQKTTDGENRAANEINCDRGKHGMIIESAYWSISGVFNKVLNMTLASFKTVFKKRLNKDRTWVILVFIIFIFPKFNDAGWTVVNFMFYRFQYKMTEKMYGNLLSTWIVLNLFSQMFVVPFLSNTMKLRDTSILVLALALAALGFFAEAFFTQTWVMFAIWSVFYFFYLNIDSTTKSVMSKLIEPTEVGKAFAVFGVLQSCLALIAKPFYGFMYQASLDIFAGLWLIVSSGFLFISLAITIILHFGMKNSEQKTEIKKVICKDDKIQV